VIEEGLEVLKYQTYERWEYLNQRFQKDIIGSRGFQRTSTVSWKSVQ
jgi:hypothetical protein